MASLHIFNRNTIDTAILSGGSWRPALSLELLREQRPTLKARSTDTQLSSTKCRLQLAKPLFSRGIQMISTNFSNASRYKITWYTDQTFATPVGTTDWVHVGSTIDWNSTGEWLDWLDPDFWLGSAAFVDPDNQGRDIRHIFAEPVTIQYVEIEIDDATNVDGFVEIGYLFVGECFVPSFNISYEPSFARTSRTTVQEAVGGATFFSRRGSQKRLTVAMQLPREEVLTDIDDIIQIHDIEKSVYVDLDPDDQTWGKKTAFLARMERLPETRIVQIYFDADLGASIGFEFIQVL